MNSMSAERVIIADPDVMNGTPCFLGTRIPFKNLIDSLRADILLARSWSSFRRSRMQWRFKPLRKLKIRC
jgi:uncharacterized protein (DUF433 family)